MATTVGTGLTVTHGTTSYSVEVLGASGAVSRAIIDVSHMGTTGGRKKIVGDLYDAGSVQIQTHLDADAEAPYTAAAETVTISFKGGATVAGSGAVSNFEWGAVVEDKQTATYTVAFLGDITWTDA